VLYHPQRGLRTRPLEQVLHGISLGILERLARQLAIPWSYESLSAHDVASSSEVMLTSTSPCVLPVVRFNGSPIGAGHPGPVFRQLLAAWSELVGVDILVQAERYAHRSRILLASLRICTYEPKTRKIKKMITTAMTPHTA